MFLGHTEILRTEKYVHSGDKDGKRYMTSLGNDAGDDFGKFPQEDRTSTNLFLAAGLGTGECDDFGTRGSPGFCWLLPGLF